MDDKLLLLLLYTLKGKAVPMPKRYPIKQYGGVKIKLFAFLIRAVELVRGQLHRQVAVSMV
jgi:hypothetical protein